MIIGLVVGCIILPTFFIVLLAVEQHDKSERQRKGLPARKYHDITDYDVTTVYTIHHTDRRK